MVDGQCVEDIHSLDSSSCQTLKIVQIGAGKCVAPRLKAITSALQMNSLVKFKLLMFGSNPTRKTGLYGAPFGGLTKCHTLLQMQIVERVVWVVRNRHNVDASTIPSNIW